MAVHKLSPPWCIVLNQSSKLVIYYGLFFFFQAEDGIRDVAVTGVQTCALPIGVFPCVDCADSPRPVGIVALAGESSITVAGLPEPGCTLHLPAVAHLFLLTIF